MIIVRQRFFGLNEVIVKNSLMYMADSWRSTAFLLALCQLAPLLVPNVHLEDNIVDY